MLSLLLATTLVARPTADPYVLWKVPLASTSFGGGAAADVDGDGIMDIALCTYFGDSKVRVLRGKNGKEIWSFDAGHCKGDACLDASCKFDDVDGDGKLDLVVPISNTGQVMAFDAATGAIKWTYEAGRGECIDTPPWIGTIRGVRSIVVGTFKSKLHVIRASDGARLRTIGIAPKGAVQSCPVVMDLNGDGVMDYLAATFGLLPCIVAADGAAMQEVPVTEADGQPGPLPVHALWQISGTGFFYHGPAVGDLDGDKKPDFAIGSYDGKVRAFKADGKPLWTRSPGERYIMGPMTIVDVDRDGSPEVIAAGENVTMYEADGTWIWSKRFDIPGSYWAVTRGVSVADLDGDGGQDFAAINGRGLFKILRGIDGKTLFEFEAWHLMEGKIENNSSVPIIADFDGDGKLDVFFVIGIGTSTKPEANRGLAVCLSGFGGPAKNPDGSAAGWFMHRHDLKNTGNTGTR